MQAYCMKCRTKREMKDPKSITMREVHFRQCIRRVLLLKFTCYLTRLGKSPYFELRKRQFSIYDDIEDAVSPWNQLSFHTKGLT